ncbi:unnamed protein product [Acanthoscelides obtectus]|uniref:Uncharacterized protein n=1 Tax=Acanthoscelides obtectus TaxID=200917 RepID=A0A9P0LYI7_ACAOB|nr:unnamed protein product [Acanthoscelides obtectus]CAK1667775.1 hypothetical protein AOBTE_LOCUS26032 [Acanthoscelides obtectus]
MELLENNKTQQETIAAQTKLIENMPLQIDELQRQINKLVKKSSTVNKVDTANMQEDSFEVTKKTQIEEELQQFSTPATTIWKIMEEIHLSIEDFIESKICNDIQQFFSCHIEQMLQEILRCREFG